MAPRGKPTEDFAIDLKVSIKLTPAQITVLAHEFGLGNGESASKRILGDFLKSYFNEFAQASAAADITQWTARVSIIP